MRGLVAVFVLAACGTDPKPIDFAIPGTPALVTEKVNGGAWNKLSGQFDSDVNATIYPIDVGDEYELVVVCLGSGANEGQFSAGELFGTSEDAEVTLSSWSAPNCVTKEPQVYVTGTVDEAMDLAVGYFTFHASPGDGFTFPASPGKHDVIAYSNTKVVIEHDVQLDADTTLAPIHVAQDGGNVAIAGVVATPDADEELYVVNTLGTRNGTIYSWKASDPAGAMFAPPELLAAGDAMLFSVYMIGDYKDRWQQCLDPRDMEDPAGLSRLAPFTRHGDGVGATWTPIPEFFTTASVETVTSNFVPSSQRVTASKLWLDRHGKSTLDFDLLVDGYDPTWVVTADLSLLVQRWSPSSVLNTWTNTGAM